MTTVWVLTDENREVAGVYARRDDAAAAARAAAAAIVDRYVGLERRIRLDLPSQTVKRWLMIRPGVSPIELATIAEHKLVEAPEASLAFVPVVVTPASHQPDPSVVAYDVRQSLSGPLLTLASKSKGASK